MYFNIPLVAQQQDTAEIRYAAGVRPQHHARAIAAFQQLPAQLQIIGIVMTRQAALMQAQNGVLVQVGVVIVRVLHPLVHLMYAIKQTCGTAKPKRSVKQLADTGIIIIALPRHHLNAAPHKNTTVMTRQAVKEPEAIGARRLEERQVVIVLMLLVQHARHHKYGIAMMKQAVKELEGVGVNHLVQQPDGVLNHHAPHIHVIRLMYGIAMTSLHAKELEVAGVYRNTGEAAGVQHHPAPYKEASAEIRYAAGVRPQHHARAIVV